MKAKVDSGKCDGTGVCEQMCPSVFKVNGDTAEVMVDDVPSDAEDTCRQAMQGCPTGAISLEG